MLRRYPGSENIVDLRVNPAAPTGSRVRTLLQHDKRWLEELGFMTGSPEEKRGQKGQPVPRQRYIPLTPEITAAAIEAFAQYHPEGRVPPMPRRDPRIPQRRFNRGEE